jgi:hypothetical protein
MLKPNYRLRIVTQSKRHPHNQSFQIKHNIKEESRQHARRGGCWLYGYYLFELALFINYDITEQQDHTALSFHQAHPVLLQIAEGSIGRAAETTRQQHQRGQRQQTQALLLRQRSHRTAQTHPQRSTINIEQDHPTHSHQRQNTRPPNQISQTQLGH